MTERMLAAVRNPHTDILGHCTGRMVTGTRKRPESEFDPEAVFAACAEAGVAVEVNSRPERLDPPKRLLRMAVEAGCRFSIDTDAHAPGQLDWLPYGCERAVACGVTAGQGGQHPLGGGPAGLGRAVSLDPACTPAAAPDPGPAAVRRPAVPPDPAGRPGRRPAGQPGRGLRDLRDQRRRVRHLGRPDPGGAGPAGADPGRARGGAARADRRRHPRAAAVRRADRPVRQPADHPGRGGPALPGPAGPAVRGEPAAAGRDAGGLRRVQQRAGHGDERAGRGGRGRLRPAHPVLVPRLVEPRRAGRQRGGRAGRPGRVGPGALHRRRRWCCWPPR